MFRRKLLTLATTTALAVGATVGLAAQPASAATPIPDHVFSPYYEMWLGDDISAVSQQAGADHITLAFAQTERQGSCTLYWNGDTSLPIAQSSFGAQVDAIQARGGNVIPSLGGWTADDATEDGQLTELADSCTDVNKIAAQIQKLITTYDVERIDFDIEADSINSSAGVDRRNKALKIVQDWAKANGRTFEVQYTLPTTTQGLAASGKNLLRNAVTNGVEVSVVNVMTFDYWEGDRANMAQDTVTATTGLVSFLRTIYPSKTDAQLWGMVGITEMIGVSDWGVGETFSLANADSVLAFAQQKGVAYLSFWALHRDTGGCAGAQTTQDDCSGLAQQKSEFSKKFASFTSGATDPTDPTDPTDSTDPTDPTDPTCTAAPWSARRGSTRPDGGPPRTETSSERETACARCAARARCSSWPAGG